MATGPVVPEPLHGFTARDLEVLKRVVIRERHRPVNTPQRPAVVTDSVYLDLSTSSATYIVRTPPEGIPRAELVGTTEDPPIEVNGVEAQVYRVNGEDGLVEIVDQLLARVYNLSTKKVPGNRWAIIEQERFGYWIVTKIIEGGLGDLAGAGECQLLNLNSNDCVVVHTYTPETGAFDYYLRFDTDDNHWRGVDNFIYPGGAGSFDFWYDSETARFRLQLASIDLLSCGDGCFSGSWLTGHGNDATGTGTGTPDGEGLPCNAFVFTVCVECSCCPVDGWEGPGWYCVTDASNTEFGTGTGTGTGTGEGDCEPLYVEDEFKCDPDLVICSGPYATRALAAAACPPLDPGPQPAPGCGDLNIPLLLTDGVTAGPFTLPAGQFHWVRIPASTVGNYRYIVTSDVSVKTFAMYGATPYGCVFDRGPEVDGTTQNYTRFIAGAVGFDTALRISSNGGTATYTVKLQDI